MDGTLTIPVLDFAEMRHRLGLSQAQDIVATLNTLTGHARSTAETIVHQMEQDALSKTRLQPGIFTLLHELETRNIPRAILTRNTQASVAHVLSTHLPKHRFDPIVTRQFVPAKPHPEPLLFIAQKWRLSPSELIMVGDSKDDLLCGKNAGSITTLLLNNDNAHLKQDADIVLNSLDELIQHLN